MNSDSLEIRAGEWVRIKSAVGILQALDAHAMRAGMPFMPEMVEHCGKRFRVHRVTHNICGSDQNRCLSDFVVLQDLVRCNGGFHGGCQFSCKFFWHKDWLLPADRKDQELEFDEGKTELLEFVRRNAKSVANDSCYVCQSTAINSASKPSKIYQLKQYQKNRSDNNVSIYQLLQFTVYVLKKKLLGQSDSLEGECSIRTPIAKLNLKVGDRVRVKTIEQIRQTLDKNGCNRGLWFDKDEMSRYCGQVMTVTRSIEKIIDEDSGHLIDLKVPSVVLSEAECSGLYRRFCNRGMLFMWRECWLTRVQ